MNVLKAIKVAELRKKLFVIPGKMLLALLILVVVMMIRNKTWNLQVLWDSVKLDWRWCCGAYVFFYGIVAYFDFFTQLIKPWFLGIVVGIAPIVVLYFTVGRNYHSIFMLIMFILVMFGPVFDVTQFFHYQRLKHEVIEAEENLKRAVEGRGDSDEAYGDGFEDGYRRGLNEAKRSSDTRQRREQKARRRMASRRRDYDDRIEESYDEDWDEDYENFEGYEDYEEYDGDYYRGRREEDADDYYEYSDEGYDDDDYYESDERYIESDSSNVAGYFADCKNQKEIKRRYRDLCKVYHPDSGNASADIFCRINNEYQLLMKQNDQDYD